MPKGRARGTERKLKVQKNSTQTMPKWLILFLVILMGVVSTFMTLMWYKEVSDLMPEVKGSLWYVIGMVAPSVLTFGFSIWLLRYKR